MLGSCSVTIAANIHVTGSTITSPLSKKLLPSGGQLVYPLYPCASLSPTRGAQESLLAPPVLCKRAIRWGPAFMAQVSKGLRFWTWEPGEKV